MQDRLEIKVFAETIHWECEGIISLVLRTIDGTALPAFAAGAHIDLQLPNEQVRQYSLIEVIGADRWVIGVSHERSGRGGSAWLHEQLRVGDRLRITGLRNAFPLVPAAPVALFGGGIGITPMLAMINTLEREGREWTLVYAARSRKSAGFLDRIAKYSSRVTLHFDDESGGVLDMSAAVAKVPSAAHLYCCGPAPMLAAYEAACAERPADQVHLERFGAEPLEGGDGDTFTVEFRKSGRTVVVAPDKTILEAASEIGLSLPSSCRNGVCGACEVEIIDGIADHRDQILDEAERASGKTMMLCCSRALSDKLVLNA